MENISINDFQLVTSGDGAYILLSLGDGQGGRIAVGTITEQIKPSIQNGVWFIGSQTTGVTAKGEDGKSVRLRQGLTGIEWAYVDEENWKVVVPYSELKLDFDDLTDEQKAQLKMTLDDLSAEDIALLQQPARDMIATLQATNVEMQAAKNDAQDTADHPTYIGIDYFVYKWNKSTKVYEKTDIYVKGEQGEQGEQGIQGVQGEQGEQGEQGQKGEDGLPPTLQLGDVTTLEAGANASAKITPNGTTADGSPIYKIDLFLPRGAKGENGSGSGNVLVEVSQLVKGKQYVFTPNQDGSAEGRFEELIVPEIDTTNLATKDELSSTDVKANQAAMDASIAKNAVATLEGLADATTAMETLSGQVVQIEENKQRIAFNKAELDREISELASEVRDMWYEEDLSEISFADSYSLDANESNPVNLGKLWWNERYKTSDYIDINGSNGYIKVTCVTHIDESDNAGIVFYDSEKNIVSGKKVIAAKEYNELTEFAVPDNAQYIRVSVLKDEEKYGGFFLLKLRKVESVIGIKMKTNEAVKDLSDKLEGINEKTSNFISENLIDYDKMVVSSYIGGTGEVIPTIYTDWAISDYIAVKPNDTIISNASKVNFYIAVYNAKKEFVRGVSDSALYTYQDGDCYIRINFNSHKTGYVANYGTELMDYDEFYNRSVKDEINLNTQGIKTLSVGFNVMVPGIDISKLYNFHKWGDNNLFGSSLNYQLTEIGDSHSMTTGYIPIEKGLYRLSYHSVLNFAVVIYDRYKRPIKRWDNNLYRLEGCDENGGVFEAPDGAKFIRICSLRDSSICLTPISVEIEADNRAYSKKKLVTIGDSITQMKPWQNYLSALVGFNYNSEETDTGVGVHYEDSEGNRYAEYADGRIEVKNAPMGLAGTGIRPVYITEQTDSTNPTWTNGNKGCSIYDRIKDAQFYNPDVILLWPCTNDFYAVELPILLGSLEDAPYIGDAVKVDYMSQEVDGLTVYSSIKGALQNLSSTCPNARIVVLGLMPWMVYNIEDYENYMLMEKKMNKVISECCALYNIQYVDMFSIGCNYWNASSYYTKQEGDDRQVHPNESGCMKIAEYLSSLF